MKVINILINTPVTLGLAFILVPVLHSQEESNDEELIELSPFVLSDEKDVGYRSMQTTSINRLAMDVIDAPFNVQILNQEVLTDLNVVDQNETFKYMNNVNSGSFSGQIGFTVMRGLFQSEDTHQRNGYHFLGIKDHFNTERVEIIKGSNSTIVGESSGAGNINTITKKATIGSNFGSLNATFGAYSRYRVALDYNYGNEQIGNMPFALRVNSFYHNEESFIRFVDKRAYGVALNFALEITPKTTLFVDFERVEEKRTQEGANADRWSGSPGLTQGHDIFLQDVNGRTIPAYGKVPDWVLETGILTAGINSSRVPTGAFVADQYGSWGDSLTTAGPDNKLERKNLYTQIDLLQKITEKFHIRGSISFNKEESTVNPRNIMAGGIFNNRYTGIEVLPDNSVVFSDTDLTKDSNGDLVNPNGPARYFQTRSWRRPASSDSRDVFEARIIANYDLDLGFTQQALTGGFDYLKREDPRGLFFDGILDSNGDNLILPVYLDDLSAQQTSQQRWLDAGGTWQRLNSVENVNDVKIDALYFGAAGKYFNGRIQSYIGVRRDSLDRKAFTGAFSGVGRDIVFTPDEAGSLTQSVTTTTFSVVFQVSKNINLFFTRSESFRPSVVSFPALRAEFFDLAPNEIAPADLLSNPTGGSAPPSQGQTYEGGIKFDILNGRLSGTVSVWDIDDTTSPGALTQIVVQDFLGTELGPDGLRLPDTTIDDRFVSPFLELFNTNGVEVEVLFNATKKISILGQYAYNDATIQTGEFAGNNLFLSFKNSGNLLIRYTETEGPLKGLYFGSNTLFRGEMIIARDLPSTRPAHTVFNAFAGYKYRFENESMFGIRLVLENMTNLRYTETHTRLGKPRSFYVTLSYDF